MTRVTVILALAASCGTALAELPTASPRIRAQLEVRLNGAGVGESVVELDRDDAWMHVAELVGYGISEIIGSRRPDPTGEFVSLSSLAPGIRFKIDERAAAILLTVAPELLGRHDIDVGTRRPPGIVDGTEPSAFGNYAVQTDASAHVSGFGEGGVGAGPALLWTGFSVPYGAGPVRGLSSFTYDFLDRLERLTVGDANAFLGGLGSSAVIAGLSFTREFSLDPYLVQAPRPATSALATTPSTLEVYVDGVLVRRDAVPAGVLDIRNLPVLAGSNHVQTVLRDAFGREQSYDLRATFSPGLLAPGRSDFGYHVGFLRGASTTTSFDYNRPVLLARHRLALSETVTAGGRGEAGLDRAMGGPSLTLGTPAGQIDLEAAASIDRSRWGGAAMAAWSSIGRHASAGVRLRLMSARFATATLDADADRALVDATVFSSFPLRRRVTLGFEAAVLRNRDSGVTTALTARTSVTLAHGFTVMPSVTSSFGGATPGLSGLLVVSWAAGARTTASAQASAQPGGTSAGLGVQRPLPIGPGYGYRVEASSGGPVDQTRAGAQWQTEHGRYEAEIDQAGSTTQSWLTASGGVVFAGERMFLTRPVEQSFGLLRVGVPGVRGYLENQEAGITDSNGDLLIPSLLPRYGNRVSIEASDIPLDYDIARTERLVAPPRKGVAIARFGVERVRALTGRLVTESGQGRPVEHGELSLILASGTVRSPTTRDGRFFLEHVGPGRHEAEAVWREGTCRATLDVPDVDGTIDVGLLTCISDPVRTASAAGPDARDAASAGPFDDRSR